MVIYREILEIDAQIFIALLLLHPFTLFALPAIRINDNDIGLHSTCFPITTTRDKNIPVSPPVSLAYTYSSYSVTNILHTIEM